MTKSNSLYIHIPFCTHICTYCDFPKVNYTSVFSFPYLKALKNELESYPKQDYKTIYVGGGTPTSLSIEELKFLLELIKPYAKNVKEYTFEANPESLTLEKAKLLGSYGVNRISLGVQTTDSKILEAINRHHNLDDVKLALSNALDSGIDNLNVDLILGLPHSDLTTLKRDLDIVLSFPIKHLSAYSLSVNPHTALGISGYQNKSDDVMREYYDYLHARMLEAGFVHYEVSNFAKPGFQSQHNQTYWKDEHYLGVGLGAASYIDNKRYKNTSSITEYIKGNYNRDVEIVSLKDDMTYFIMLNLRTNHGIDLDLFKTRFNFDLLTKKEKEIKNLILNNLLFLDDNHLIATYEGMMLLDDIILKMME